MAYINGGEILFCPIFTASKLAEFASGTLTDITETDLKGVTSIRDYAFSRAPIKTIVIPDGVTNIGASAFNICKSLESAIVPASVTSMGNGCFMQCTALTKVTMLPTTPPTLANALAFYGCDYVSIIVPKGCGEAYKSATNWSEYADKITEASE